MKPLRKFVTSLIGFDRRERRGTYVLTVILILFLLAPGGCLQAREDA